MARRDTRSSSSGRAGSSSRGASARDTGPRVGRDGKVEISCPQCAAQYRIAPDKLDTKIECADCHRVFFAKTTAGKRVAAPDHTKTYLIFGLVGVVLVGGLLLMNSGSKPAPANPTVSAAPKPPEFNVGSHPRTAQLIKWAQGLAGDNRLVLKTHSDLNAIGKQFGLKPPIDADAVIQKLVEDDSTYYLRKLACDSGALASEAAMTADSGTAMLYVTPNSGDDTWKRNTRAEIEVTWRMDGNQVLVTGWKTTLPPVRNPGKADPLAKPAYVVNKDIAKAEAATITDSAGTRTVRESKPAAVPHYGKATPDQQKMADEIVAAILQSADPEVPGSVFNRALQRVQSIEERKATVPRVLNAMFEQYGDVNANNMKLSQLNRALVTLTGFAVNYQVENSSDPQKDKAARESCVRQWFAFWYKYSENFAEFYESGESLEMPKTDDGKQPAPKTPGK